MLLRPLAKVLECVALEGTANSGQTSLQSTFGKLMLRNSLLFMLYISPNWACMLCKPKWRLGKSEPYLADYPCYDII